MVYVYAYLRISTFGRAVAPLEYLMKAKRALNIVPEPGGLTDSLCRTFMICLINLKL